MTKSVKGNMIRKKLAATAICLVLIIALLVGFSQTRYVTRNIQGSVEYDPALFNTVLLGDVTEALKKSGDSSIAVSNAVGSSSAYGVKITESLNLSEASECNTAEGGLKPGMEQIAIPFTIANGTTVVDDATNEEKVANVAECDITYTLHIITTMNLPLVYTLKDIDTGKEYSLTYVSTTDDYSPETSISADSKMTNTPYFSEEVGGYCNDLTIKGPSATVETDGDFTADGERLLKLTVDNSTDQPCITMHRYQLLVDWPVDKETTYVRYYIESVKDQDTQEKEDVLKYRVVSYNVSDLHSIEYMKEVENIEIKVEVDSYVSNSSVASDVAKDVLGDGLISLSATGVTSGNFFSWGDVSQITDRVYGEKTVRYDNLGNTAAGSGSAASAHPQAFIGELSSLGGTSKTYTYKFDIRNCDDFSLKWVDTDADDEEDEVTGYYEINGTFVSAEGAHIALGLLTGESGNGRNRISGQGYGYDYYLGLDTDGDEEPDLFYAAGTNSKIAEATGNETPGDDASAFQTAYVKVTQWIKSVIPSIFGDSQKQYDYTSEEESAYQFVNFYPISYTDGKYSVDTDNVMTIEAMSSTEYECQSYTLYVVDRNSDYTYLENKDEFEIYVYK